MVGEQVLQLLLLHLLLRRNLVQDATVTLRCSEVDEHWSVDTTMNRVALLVVVVLTTYRTLLCTTDA